MTQSFGDLKPGMPGYWMHETSGVLRPVIDKYVKDEPMTDWDCMVMKLYLRQWINADGWLPGKALDKLRRDVEQINSRADISRWLHDAGREGIDPL